MTDLSPHATDDLLADDRLRLLLEASVDAIMVLGPTAQVIWASPATEALLERSLDELRVIDPLELVHPDDLPEAGRLLGRMYDGIEEDDPAVLRLLTGSGGEVWVEIKGKDLSDVAGVGGMVLTARDMSYRIDLEEALRTSHRRFESLLSNSNDGIVVLDSDLRFTYASPSMEQISGFPPEAMIGTDASAVVLEPQRTDLLDALARVIADAGHVESLRVRVRHADGEPRWFAVRVSNNFDDPAIAGVIVNVRDVTDTVAAETEAARLTEIFELTEDLVAVHDGDGILQYMNPACARFFGFDPDAAPIGTVWQVEELALQSGESPRFAGATRTWSTEVTLTGAAGTRVPFAVQVIGHHDVDGRIFRYSSVAHDISESRDLAASLERQALHDPLTGLPNRTLLEQRMRSGPPDQPGAVPGRSLLFIDLDHFKVINDSLGHAFGDRVLRAVAERVRSVVRPKDLVARFGGDEFVVLCEETVGPETGRDIARRVRDVLLRPVVIEDTPVHLGVSIGIAHDPAGCLEDPGALIRDADTAMYQAKARGRGQVVLFDEDLRRRAVDRQRVESALREAPVDESLVLHYQPIVDLADGRLRGVEALVRWRHDDHLLGPDEFIPIAEETDLILPLGRWVLEAACADLANWQRIPGWERLGISVNASVRQLLDDGFVRVLTDAMNRYRIPRRSLTLEITESVLLDDAAMQRSRIDRLDQLGINLAIDDFGTGYSSLTYLTRLPADVVKLDRAFLDSVGSDRVRSRMVSGVIDLVKVLGLRCVAEGIESEDQFRLLGELGCHTGQGYHIARPMPSEQLVDLLQRLDPAEPWPRQGSGIFTPDDSAPRRG